MEYSPSIIGQQFSFAEEPSAPLNRNQRRLQLRHSLSNRTIPKANTYNGDSIILQKTRQRSSSGSSTSSTRSTSSPFDNFRIYSEYPGEDSKPSTPEVVSPLRLGESTTKMELEINQDSNWRKASVYSEASTLVEGGFGDLIGLGNQTLVGPRFYDSGSGSGSDRSFRKRNKDSSVGRSATKKTARRKVSGRKGSGGSDGYTTPPRRTHTLKESSYHPYFDMHPEDAAKYIEHLEAQAQDLTAQLHNLTSPTSTASNVAKLKKLTAENRALKNELEEWQTAFEDKVKEECRSRIIANEKEARARIRAAEHALEECRETVQILNADLEKMKEIFQEVLQERIEAESGRREAERNVQKLTELLREKENQSRSSSRASDYPRQRVTRGRYSYGSPPGSPYDGRNRKMLPRPLSISLSQYGDSDEEEGSPMFIEEKEDVRESISARMDRQSFAGSPRAMSPTMDFAHSNAFQSRRRFEGGKSPQPLVLPTVVRQGSPTPSNVNSPLCSPVQIATQQHFRSSRPSSAHSNAPSISLYSAGLHANMSNISIDSAITTSVHSVLVGNTAAQSLFAELERLDDSMSDVASASHKDDQSEYSAKLSRVQSNVSLAGMRSLVPLQADLIDYSQPVNSAQTTSYAVSTITEQSSRVSIFSVFTSSGPLHIVADAMTRNTLGKVLVAVGHGLRSPRRTLTQVRSKACDVIGKVLTGDRGTDRVTKRRRRVFSSRADNGEDRGCAHCSTYDRGRKKVIRSTMRSVSAPISSRVSYVRLSADTPMEGLSREPSRAPDDRSPSRCPPPPQHRRKRRISTTSKVGGKLQEPEPVKRQHTVHAGDNVWMWFKFLMAIVVTLGVAVNKDDRDSYLDEDDTYHIDEVAVDDGDISSDDNYMGELDEDDDTLQIKVEKWRRQPAEISRSHQLGFFEYFSEVLGLISVGGIKS